MRSAGTSVYQSRFAVCASIAAFLILAAYIPASPDVSVPKHVLTWAADDGGGGQTDGATMFATNPTSQRHIQTWVSFAETGTTARRIPTKAYLDCHADGSSCKLVIYYDPGKLYANCSGPDRDFVSQNTSEDFYLHDSAAISSSNRTTRSQSKWCNGSPVFYPNWNNPAVGQWYARNILRQFPQNSNTMMFQDDSNADCPGHFHAREAFVPYELQGGSGCEASIAHGLRTVADQMRWKDGTPVQVIVNGLAVTTRSRSASTAGVALVAPGSNIIGGVSENAIISGTGYTPLGVFADVNTASLVYAENSAALFGLLGRSFAAAGSDHPCTGASHYKENDCGTLQQRRSLTAAFWLAYKEGHTILWERFSGDDPHILGVYPEASIYPKEPVQVLNPFDPNVATTDGSGCGSQVGSGGIKSFVVACGTLDDGETPAGVYVREFRRCYNFGQLVGAGQCAVVMNTTNRAVTVSRWFANDYTSVMVWGTGPVDGADVLTAGCGNAQCPKNVLNPLGASFALGQTQVPAFDALFLFHS